ncbi:hypothetical protein V7S43_004811 [Phytophthora oleae]|uniref:Uncharacterized protein n=1 Tax=Phytophthora oleae TaxID=2107226 RepID=A0ABD3FXX4_9STRA
MSTLAVPVLWKDGGAQGVTGLVELQMSDLPLNARVGDVFPVLKSKINAMLQAEQRFRNVDSTLHYGIPLSPDRPLDPLIPESRVTPQFLAIMKVCSKDRPRRSITIWARSLLFCCETSDTVEHDTLSSYAHLSPGYCYGNPSQLIADALNDLILTGRELSEIGPSWRMVCYGLNIEGKCENTKCEAFRRMVIHHGGYEVFISQDDKIQCPLWFSNVKPLTFGFTTVYGNLMAHGRVMDSQSLPSGKKQMEACTTASINTTVVSNGKVFWSWPSASRERNCRQRYLPSIGAYILRSVVSAGVS